MMNVQWPSEPTVPQDRHGQGLPCAFCTSRVPDIDHQPAERRHAIVHDVIVCRRCLPVVETILAESPGVNQLRAEHEALTKVYVAAARLRTFPVPFDDHFSLVGMVDECRSMLEPPVDVYADAPSPANVSDWQKHVEAYPREEFLVLFRDAHATLHQLWTAAVGKEGYDKAPWKALDNALSRFARDTAEKVGISRSEPLL